MKFTGLRSNVLSQLKKSEMMKTRSDLWFIVAKMYSHLYGFFKDNFNIHIRGLGYILRMVKCDYQLLVNRRHIYFAHEMAEAYARPLHGKWNEPETHKILVHVMDKLKVTFIDVGANIGEILIDAAAHPNCVEVIAFEPNPVATNVINKNIALNSLINCTVINKALGHVETKQKMFFGSHSPTASLLSTESATGDGVEVDVSTLDAEIDAKALNQSAIILLVDVEGYELNVIRGGGRLISHSAPLIIFEYHKETKKVFGLAEVQHQLGHAYQIYRVRQDARLDHDVENAWNCVAIPKGSEFEAILQPRIVN
jgi:FkbM family methyltransferase